MSSFKELNNYFDSMYPRVYSVVRFIVRDLRDADEVMNDIRLKIFQNQSKLEIEHLDSWIYKVARNAAFSKKEAQKKFKNDISIEDVSIKEHEITSSDNSLYFVVVDKETTEEIRNYVKRLSDKYSSLIALHLFDGLSCAEISEKLDINLNTVRIRLWRGKENLRRKMRKEKPS